MDKSSIADLLETTKTASPESNRLLIDKIASACIGDLARNATYLTAESYHELLKEVHDRVSCSLGYIKLGRLEEGEELTIVDDNSMPLMEEVN